MLKCGQVLNNGATVLEMKGNKVLAFRAGTSQPFVIWRMDIEGNCHNGTYFKRNITACRAWEKI